MDGGGLTRPWKNESTVHDLQFTSNSDGPLQWTAGLFSFEEETDRSLLVSYFQFGQVGFPNRDYKVESQAAYADFTYDFAQDWQLFFGVRYTEDEKSNNGAYETRLQSSDCANEILASELNPVSYTHLTLPTIYSV